MQKLIKEIKNNQVQITLADERWYVRPVKNKEGIPEIKYYPSSTWICSHYPKGIQYFKWLASKGWDEAEAIKTAAGDKGSKVHEAINDLLDGKEIKMEDKYINKSTGLEEELTIEEYDCLLGFNNWYKDNQPETISKDFAVFNDKDGYAGTVDYLCKVNDKVYLVDFKTSSNIWPEHRLQVSSYKHAIKNVKVDLALLQVGYNRNKKGYKFSVIDDCYDLFLAAKCIWDNEVKDKEPKAIYYPRSIKL